MKILKQGYNLKETQFQFNCKVCKCVFECSIKEGQYFKRFAASNIFYVLIKSCPNCNIDCEVEL